jgi:hypothetical protein
MPPMHLPPLLRLRRLPCPTLSGALLIAGLAAGGAWLALRALPGFLAPDQPLGRGTLVVEGWVPREALHLAAQTFRRGGYDRLVVSGGPVDDVLWNCGAGTYAERAAAEMRLLGIVEPSLVVAPAPETDQDRTYRSAVAVRQWFESLGQAPKAIDVFSHGPHARRSRALYRQAFGEGVEVGVRAAPSARYDLSHWWRTSEGAKDVLSEAAGYAWMLCCFHPGRRGSPEELGAPERGGP